MTYLFVVIALPVINAMLMKGGDLALLGTVNAIMVALLWALEREWGFNYESHQSVRYDRIELITRDRRDELLVDLRQRTGLPIKRVEVGRINFLNDTADLRLFYDEPKGLRPARTFFPDAAEGADDDD